MAICKCCPSAIFVPSERIPQIFITALFEILIGFHWHAYSILLSRVIKIAHSGRSEEITSLSGSMLYG
jgi:hypothetical protein